MPNLETIYSWRNADQEFSKNLVRARKDQAEVWADELIHISDRCEETHEAIGKARLKMASRQFLMGKFNPQFADKDRGDVHVTQNVAVVLSVERQKELQERKARALEGV